MSEGKRPSLILVGLAALWCPGFGYLLIGKMGKAVLSAIAMVLAMFLHFFIARFGPVAYLIGLLLFFVVYVTTIWLTLKDAKKVSFATPKKISLSVKILFAVVVLGSLLSIKKHRTWLPGDQYVQSSAGLFPSVHTGERLYVDHLVYHFQEPKRGEIALFTTRNGGNVIFSKRIVGIPGDRIAWTAGELLVNDKKAVHTFVSAVSEQDEKTSFSDSKDGKHRIYKESFADTSYEIVLGETNLDTSDRETITVPEGSYYVLGDHRNASNDSRAIGFISKRDLIGKGIYILWSRSDGQKIDWTRIGKKVTNE